MHNIILNKKIVSFLEIIYNDKNNFMRCIQRYMLEQQQGGNFMANTTRREKTLRLAQLGILTAIIILMSFTPLGYLRVGTVSITFLAIPVVIGAIVMGPLYGGILGVAFGLTSFAQCFGIDPFGTALMGINPLYTFIMCFVPRVLIGVVSGYLSRGLQRKNVNQVISFAISSFAGSLTNTVLFIGLFVLFFRQSEFVLSLGGVFKFVTIVLIVNSVIEAVVTTIVGTAVSKALIIANKRYTTNTSNTVNKRH